MLDMQLAIISKHSHAVYLAELTAKEHAQVLKGEVILIASDRIAQVRIPDAEIKDKQVLQLDFRKLEEPSSDRPYRTLTHLTRLTRIRINLLRSWRRVWRRI